ncbi:MAG TPA: ice-binding family protein [Gallionella sp.]
MSVWDTFLILFWQKLFLRRLIINHRQKHLSACLIALAALLSTPIQGAWAATAPALGTASGLSVLAGTAVTCTGAAVTGNVGVSPGSAFTNTGCTITGMTPPDTNVAAVGAHTDFLSAYATLQLQSSSCIQMLGNLANQNLGPGVYCVEAVAKTGMLTLTGPSDGVWIFLVNGALTGTNFSVAMAGGGQPCNVFWAPSGAVTMTDSAFTGNILAGDAAIGSITLTRGTLTGQALANVAVTMTGTSVAGSGGCHPDYLLNPFGP